MLGRAVLGRQVRQVQRVQQVQKVQQVQQVQQVRQAYIVRHIRKPIWLPTAPSKLFRIPPRTVIPEADKQELMMLFNHYRTKVRGVRRFLREEQIAIKSSLANIHSEKSKLEIEREWERSFAENDAWNKEIAEDRDRYLEQKAKKREEEILTKIIEVDKKRDEECQLAKEKLEKEMELSVNFITRETLDEALEKCFRSEVDYNFGIDLEENIYEGRETNPKNLLSETFD